MLFSYGYGQQRNWLQKMQANWQRFQSPCRRGNTAQFASPNGAHPWLHAKPLDAAIGQVPTPYCPGGCHGQWFWMKHKNSNKTQLLPSFFTVDQRKVAKQFWDPKRTLNSPHWYNKLHKNVKHYYLSWKAQLHFELSNVVNEQKFKKLLALNEAQKYLWAKYNPIAVKLLMLCRHKNMQPNDHPHYAAMAICRCINTQLALVLCSYGKKYANCSPAMWLRQYTSTKIRDLLVPQLHQFAGTKICNGLDPLELEAAHNKGAIMYSSICWQKAWGSTWRHDDAWKMCPMAAQCQELAPDGGPMLERSAQWWHNGDN